MLRWWVVGALVVMIGTSCAPALTARDFPPSEPGAIGIVYGSAFDRLGYDVVAIGGLLTAGNYEPSPTGSHLAIYVSPQRELKAAEYRRGIDTTAELVVPDAFERWRGVESLDVCQLLPGTDDPATRVDVTRGAVARESWTVWSDPELR